jgi:hypothetical protein
LFEQEPLHRQFFVPSSPPRDTSPRSPLRPRLSSIRWGEKILTSYPSVLSRSHHRRPLDVACPQVTATAKAQWAPVPSRHLRPLSRASTPPLYLILHSAAKATAGHHNTLFTRDHRRATVFLPLLNAKDIRWAHADSELPGELFTSPRCVCYTSEPFLRPERCRRPCRWRGQVRSRTRRTLGNRTLKQAVALALGLSPTVVVWP